MSKQTRLERIARSIARGAIGSTITNGAWTHDAPSFASNVMNRARALEEALDAEEGREKVEGKELEELRDALRHAVNTVNIGAEVFAELNQIFGTRPGESLADAARRATKPPSDEEIEREALARWSADPALTSGVLRARAEFRDAFAEGARRFARASTLPEIEQALADREKKGRDDARDEITAKLVAVINKLRIGTAWIYTSPEQALEMISSWGLKKSEELAAAVYPSESDIDADALVTFPSMNVPEAEMPALEALRSAFKRGARRKTPR